MGKRSEYFKRYYREKIRPFLYPEGVKQKPRIRYRCVLCGMVLPSPSRLGLYEPDVFLSFGYNTFDAFNTPSKYQIDSEILGLFEDKRDDYLKSVGFRCIDVLNVCISRGLLTKKEVGSLLGIKSVASVRPPNRVGYPNVVGFAHNSSPFPVGVSKIKSPFIIKPVR